MKISKTKLKTPNEGKKLSSKSNKKTRVSLQFTPKEFRNFSSAIRKKVVDKLMTLGRQRLALMLDSLTQPGRRIDRSQTFSDHPHRPVSFVKIKNSSNILS